MLKLIYFIFYRIIADIIQEVIRLLNKLLPKELKLSIISIKITENVIIIKIGQGKK